MSKNRHLAEPGYVVATLHFNQWSRWLDRQSAILAEIEHRHILPLPRLLSDRTLMQDVVAGYTVTVQVRAMGYLLIDQKLRQERIGTLVLKSYFLEQAREAQLAERADFTELSPFSEDVLGRYWPQMTPDQVPRSVLDARSPRPGVL